MKKRTTSNGSDWEKICREIYCLKLAQLIKSANRLHIFGIRSFDNTKYFKIDKWISLREICIEIDHLAIQPVKRMAQNQNPKKWNRNPERNSGRSNPGQGPEAFCYKSPKFLQVVESLHAFSPNRAIFLKISAYSVALGIGGVLEGS